MASTSSNDYAQYFVNLIDNNKSALGVQAVYYGDVQQVAVTPTVCIEPGRKHRVYNGAPRRVMCTIDTHIIIYHGAVQSTSLNQKEIDQTVSEMEILVHADATLGGMAIDSVVREVEPGYQVRGNSLFRASMLTVEARQQELLPLNF